MEHISVGKYFTFKADWISHNSQYLTQFGFYHTSLFELSLSLFYLDWKQNKMLHSSMWASALPEDRVTGSSRFLTSSAVVHSSQLIPLSMQTRLLTGELHERLFHKLVKTLSCFATTDTWWTTSSGTYSIFYLLSLVASVVFNYLNLLSHILYQ